MTALTVGTVFACVNIISGAFASLPLNVYEHINKNDRHGKKLTISHPLWDILHNEPNPEMTAFTFFKTLKCHALLWANAYAEIQRDQNNQIIALWPRNPARTRAIRTLKPIELEGTLYPAGTLIYETTEMIIGSEPTMAVARLPEPDAMTLKKSLGKPCEVASMAIIS